jgi:hypothetical protein
MKPVSSRTGFIAQSLKPRAVIAGHKRVGNEIALGSLKKRGSISAISSASPCRRRPRGNYMTKCSSPTLIGSIEVRSGVQSMPQKTLIILVPCPSAYQRYAPSLFVATIIVLTHLSF